MTLSIQCHFFQSINRYPIPVSVMKWRGGRDPVPVFVANASYNYANSCCVRPRLDPTPAGCGINKELFVNKQKGRPFNRPFLLCFINRVYFSVQSVVRPDHTVSNQGRSRWNRTAWLLPRMSTAHKSCTSRQQKQQSLQLSLLRGAH